MTFLNSPTTRRELIDGAAYSFALHRVSQSN
jgi:hypothetical protein